MKHDYIHRGTESACMADNTFHTAYLLNIVELIGIIVHCRFHKQQVRYTFLQYIVFKTEGMRRTSGRRYSGINKSKFRIGETLFQIFLYHIPPTAHFSNGTAEKGNATFFLFRELQIRVSKVSTLMNDMLFLIIRLVANNEVNYRFGVFQAMGVMAATGFQNDFYKSAQSTVTVSYNFHILFIGDCAVTITTNTDNRDTCIG